jgi:hypothetical protein
MALSIRNIIKPAMIAATSAEIKLPFRTLLTSKNVLMNHRITGTIMQFAYKAILRLLAG